MKEQQNGIVHAKTNTRYHAGKYILETGNS